MFFKKGSHKTTVYKSPTMDRDPRETKVEVTSGDSIGFPIDVESAASSYPESAGESPDEVLLESPMETQSSGSPKPTNTKPIIDKDLTVVEVKNNSGVHSTSNIVGGRVVYEIPEQMKVRNTYQVLLRISKSKKTISVYEGLTGMVKTSEIPVTQTMEVKLIDPSPDDDKYFKIVSDNEAVQLVDSGETYTQWTWNVTPIRVGNSNLKIVVSIIRDGNRKDVVYQDTVEVQKDIKTQVIFFIKSFWQWITGTLLLPFFGFLYKKYKERGNNSPSNSD